MIKVAVGVDIDRPVDEVFAFVIDPYNAPRWRSAIIEVKHADPPGVGARWTGIVKFLGRRSEGTSETTEYEPNRKLVERGRAPSISKTTLSLVFSPRDAGTRLDAVLEAEPEGIVRLAKPLVEAKGRKQLTANLVRLKGLLETGSAASSSSNPQAAV